MSAYRCVAKDSDVLHRRRLYHFVSRGAMNIDGVGPRIIDLLLEHNLINTASDLFTLTEGDLVSLPGLKEKSAQNVIAAIHAVRTVPLARLLVALSIEHVGEETARVIAESVGTIEKLRSMTVSDLAALYGVGEVVAESLVSWLGNKAYSRELDTLLSHLTIEGVKRAGAETALSGKTVVFTGSLPSLSRSEAEARAREAGAHVTSSVSKHTNYVIAGSDPGSKAEKAESLGVPILTEAAFLALLKK
jgi:DNA ligase (NAD+)